jgi:cell division transport system permease protein
VRRPFLWTGFWYGLLGGGVALLLVQYGLYLLKAPVTRLAGLYQGNISIAALGWSESAAIIGIAIALGLFGSWFTAARHMHRFEPR